MGTQIISNTKLGLIFAIIALVFAIALTVLAYIFIVPEKKRERLNKFGKILHDFLNFKFFFVEKILQALYILSTAYVVLFGFFQLFIVTETYWGDYKWQGGSGFLYMILGPIVIRIVYELTMMAITLVKNVVEINKNVKTLAKSSDNVAKDAFNPSFTNEDKD